MTIMIVEYSSFNQFALDTEFSITIEKAPRIILLVKNLFNMHYVNIIGIHLDSNDEIDYFLIMDTNGAIGHISYCALKKWMDILDMPISGKYCAISLEPESYKIYIKSPYHNFKVVINKDNKKQSWKVYEKMRNEDMTDSSSGYYEFLENLYEEEQEEFGNDPEYEDHTVEEFIDSRYDQFYDEYYGIELTKDLYDIRFCSNGEIVEQGEYEIYKNCMITFDNDDEICQNIPGAIYTNNNAKAKKLLLSLNGSQLEWHDEGGDTFLHIACKANNTCIALFLIENQLVDLFTYNLEAQTAMDIAKFKKNNKIYKKLSYIVNGSKSINTI